MAQKWLSLLFITFIIVCAEARHTRPQYREYKGPEETTRPHLIGTNATVTPSASPSHMTEAEILRKMEEVEKERQAQFVNDAHKHLEINATHDYNSTEYY